MTPKIIRTREELAALDPDAVVVATGDQVRAARQSPGEASTGDFHRSIGLWQPPPATWEEA